MTAMTHEAVAVPRTVPMLPLYAMHVRMLVIETLRVALGP